MPKVAVCFSGLPRITSNITVQQWQHYIEKYNADVFIHTWVSDNSELDNARRKFTELFKPIVVKYEQPRQYPIEEYQERVWWSVVVYNVFSAYAGIYESNNLAIQYSKQKGFEYDYIIRARFDVLTEGLTLEPTNGVVITSDHNKHRIKFNYRDLTLTGLNDLVAYGSPSAMAVYSDVINHIPVLYKEDGVDMCSEILLSAHLFKQDIPVELKPIKTTIVRG